MTSTITPRLAAYRLLDLEPLRNNIGVTGADRTAAGGLNVWRNSLPAEQLPPAGTVTVDGIPFAFPGTGTGEPDNVRCAGQVVPVPPGRYDWIYLLATAERRVEDEVALHFTDGQVDFEPLRVSDFWAAVAHFGETRAYATTSMHYPHHVQPRVTGLIWCQRVAVTRRAELRSLRLPTNPAVHVFAATLQEGP
ncbi:hypothetical protein [Micromonospora sp. DT229]|uniref:hypothetical protein n=1 Tax=Micromonospora sp. DT229 TaxID=3393430 RepID=UPI003CEB9D39